MHEVADGRFAAQQILFMSSYTSPPCVTFNFLYALFAKLANVGIILADPPAFRSSRCCFSQLAA
jgi:hypothetical protein